MTGRARMIGPHWRRVLATLNNNDALTAYSDLTLGTPPFTAEPLS
ncbi:hypothetical protein [Arthrobacter sp. NPDC058192]